MQQPAVADAARPRPGRMKLVFISIVTTPRRAAMPGCVRRCAPHAPSPRRAASSSTPPCATPQELCMCSAAASTAISASPPSKRSSSKPSISTKGMWAGNFIAAGVRIRRRQWIADTPPSTARIWPVMCLPASRANSSAAPFRSSSSPRRPSGAARGQLVVADALERACGHLAREEARRERVDVDAVRAPFAGQRAREVDHRALAGVVGDGLHRRRGCRPARRSTRR